MERSLECQRTLSDMHSAHACPPARSIVYGSILTLAMPIRETHPLEGDMLQGTLDLLILQTLVLGPAHGHTIAHAIEHRSEDVLQVEHGSLYPALHRLENRRWISSFWGTSENNRKARYYRLTATGRKQLLEQTSRWDRLVQAVNRVLRPAAE
jgi:PadR family transcriptional regulator, regulatory protein PadR